MSITKLNICFLYLFLFSAILISSAHASEMSCGESLEKMSLDKIFSSVESRYKTIKSIKANFSQNSYFLGTEESRASEGELLFTKPGKMDWFYHLPEKQRFISNGETLWFYQPSLNQVSLGDFKNSFDSDLPISFLLGIGNLREKFIIDSACNKEDGLLVLFKTKTADVNVSEFYLLVDKKDYSPKGAKVIDIGGNETTINLKNIVLNSSIDSQVFEFEIPRGVDILDNRALSLISQ